MKDREQAGENVGVVVEDIDEIVQAAPLLRFVTSIRSPRHTAPHLRPEESSRRILSLHLMLDHHNGPRSVHPLSARTWNLAYYNTSRGVARPRESRLIKRERDRQ